MYWRVSSGSMDWEDVYQGMFLKVFAYLERVGKVSFSSEDEIEKWLIRVMYNHVIDLSRYHRFRKRGEILLVPLTDAALENMSDSHSIDERLTADELLSELLGYIRTWSSESKRETAYTVLLYAGEEVPSSARPSGVTVSAWKSRVYKARLLMRQWYVGRMNGHEDHRPNGAHCAQDQ